MPRYTLIKNIFTAGEIMQEVWGRIDKSLYATGLGRCENFIPTKRGGLARRRGTTRLLSIGTFSAGSRLVPFEFSRDDSTLLIFSPVFGGSILRLRDPGVVVVEVRNTGFTAAIIASMDIVQSGDVITITSPHIRPHHLTREANGQWSYAPVFYTNRLLRPTNITATADTTGSVIRRYVVTAEFGDHGESLAGYGRRVVITRGDIRVRHSSQYIDVGIRYTPLNNYILNELSRSEQGAALAVGSLGVINVSYTQSDGTIMYANVNVWDDFVLEIRYQDYRFWTRINVGVTPTFVSVGIGSGSSDTEELVLDKLPYSIVQNSRESVWDNTITWNEVAEVRSYNVYAATDRSAFGFIGNTDRTTFADDHIAPDLSLQPPSDENPFDANSDGVHDIDRYPNQIAYAFERLVMANTRRRPQTMFLSQTGDFDNFTVNTPTRDTDSISIDLVSGRINNILHLIGINDLLVFTAGDEWLVRGSESRVLTPDTINARAQSSYGSVDSNLLKPLVSGSSIIFMQRGYRVRDLAYSWESDLYQGNELSILSEHLLTGDGYKPTSWCYAELPDDIIWITTKNTEGNTRLISLTYLKEQNIIAWARHTRDDGGEWEQVVRVREGDTDGVYFIIIANDGGVHIERMHDDDRSAYRDGMTSQGTGGTGFVSLIETLPFDLPMEQLQTLADTEVRISHINFDVIMGDVTMSYKIRGQSPDEPEQMLNDDEEDDYIIPVPSLSDNSYKGILRVYTGAGWGLYTRMQLNLRGDGAAYIRSISHLVDIADPSDAPMR